MDGLDPRVVGALTLWVLVILGVIVLMVTWWISKWAVRSVREVRGVKRLQRELDALEAAMEEERRSAGADEL